MHSIRSSSTWNCKASLTVEILPTTNIKSVILVLPTMLFIQFSYVLWAMEYQCRCMWMLMEACYGINTMYMSVKANVNHVMDCFLSAIIYVVDFLSICMNSLCEDKLRLFCMLLTMTWVLSMFLYIVNMLIYKYHEIF